MDSKETNIFEFMDGWGSDWISSTCIVRFKSKKDKEETIQNFKDNNIPHRDWWNRGCHQENAFKSFKKGPSLSNTPELADRTLGIPFHLFLA